MLFLHDVAGLDPEVVVVANATTTVSVQACVNK